MLNKIFNEVIDTAIKVSGLNRDILFSCRCTEYVNLKSIIIDLLINSKFTLKEVSELTGLHRESVRTLAIEHDSRCKLSFTMTENKQIIYRELANNPITNTRLKL